MSWLSDLFKPNIQKMKSNRDAKGLIKVLKHKDPEIRADAIDAMYGLSLIHHSGSYGGDGSFLMKVSLFYDSVYISMRDPDPRVRKAALEFLEECQHWVLTDCHTSGLKEKCEEMRDHDEEVKKLIRISH